MKPFLLRLLISGLLVATAASAGRAAEPYLPFLHALEANHDDDLAVEYLQRIGKRPDLPPEVRTVYDYELGKALIELGSAQADPARRLDAYRDAAAALKRFIGAQNQASAAARLVPDAIAQLGRVFVERGRVEVLQASLEDTAARRDAARGRARGLFAKAREDYQLAVAQLEQQLKAYPVYIGPDRPALLAAKEQTKVHLMDAQFKLGLVFYDSAQTFDRNAPPYRDNLQAAGKTFREVTEKYRGWLAALYARMWEGKTFEEMGGPENVRKALGIYDELLKHQAEGPSESERGQQRRALDLVQRQVEVFRLEALNQRNDESDALTVISEAQEWMRRNVAERRTALGMAVQLEWARALIRAGLRQPERSPDRRRMLDHALALLNGVARSPSEYRLKAVALRTEYAKYFRGRQFGGPNFEEEVGLMEQAIGAHRWADAARHGMLALAQADREPLAPAIGQLDRARYELGYTFFKLGDPYAAAVLCDHVARRDAQSPVAPDAASVVMAAFAAAYRARTTPDRASDLAHLMSTCRFIVAAWPPSTQADEARMVIGQVELSRGHDLAAARAFAAVDPGSARFPEAQLRAGQAYWQAYRAGLQGPAAGRQASALRSDQQKARQALETSAARQRAGLAPGQPVPAMLVEAELYLAENQIESGQDRQAAAMLQPIVDPVSRGRRKDLEPFAVRLLIAALRADVGIGDVDRARGVMQAIETLSPDNEAVARVYVALGRQLENQVQRLRTLGDSAAVERTRAAYIKFLDELAHQTQTAATLEYTGEAYYSLGLFDSAAQSFEALLKKFGQDPEWTGDPKRRTTLDQVRLRLAEALAKSALADTNLSTELRNQKLQEAIDVLTRLYRANPRFLDVRMALGHVLEDRAELDPHRWTQAANYWNNQARYLERLAQKPVQYFEARYNLADCLDRAGRPGDAAVVLRTTMSLSQNLGGPEWKARYEALLARATGQIGPTD